MKNRERRQVFSEKVIFLGQGWKNAMPSLLHVMLNLFQHPGRKGSYAGFELQSPALQAPEMNLGQAKILNQGQDDEHFNKEANVNWFNELIK